MSSRARLLGLATLGAMLAAGAWLWSHRTLRLSLRQDHPVVGRLLTPAVRRSVASAEIAGAPALLAKASGETSPRARLLLALGEPANEPVDFGLGADGTETEIARRQEGCVDLPAVATALLRAEDNPLLVLHTREPAELARVASRRGWIGPLASEVLGSAQAINLVVGADANDDWLRITLALEYADGSSAEAALRRLTQANGDPGQLGFIAQPGYERIVRRTSMVVIRLDARAESAARHMPRR